jgi:SSS family solute:Na+ symporter/sodium/proline symporter
MIYITVVAAVVLVLCGVTIWKAISVRNEADFLVAGRKLPWAVLVFTLLSSWIGAGSLFAGGENAYKNGFAALWQPAGGWLGLIVIARIAGRARRFAQYTVPDLLETRYNAAARVLATIAIVISYTTIASYQMIAGGDVLHLIFPDLDRGTAMLMIAGFVIAFTAGAGMASVAYLDLVIGGLMTTVVVIAFPVLVSASGGWDAITARLPQSHLEVFGNLTPQQALGYLIPSMLLLIGNQGMYQKFFSARSERDARWAVFGWIAGALLLETLIVSIAVVGRANFAPTADFNAREIIPTVARRGLPAVLGAVLLGGIFAKLISTANNFLFSPATNLIHDVYSRFIDPGASEKRKLVVSRLVVIGLGVYAVIQATQFTSILDAAVYAYTVYGAAVTPVIMAVFFWKRATTAGAIASIAIGTVVTVTWRLAGMRPELGIYPGLGASLACLLAVSLATAPPAKEKIEPFFTEARE